MDNHLHANNCQPKPNPNPVVSSSYYYSCSCYYSVLNY